MAIAKLSLHCIFNEIKSGIKNSTEVALNLSSNVIGDSNDKINFPHKLLLTNRNVSRLYIVFVKS